MLAGIAGSRHRLTSRMTLLASGGGEAGETEALLIRASRACAIDVRLDQPVVDQRRALSGWSYTVVGT